MAGLYWFAVQRRRPGDPSADMLLATLGASVPSARAVRPEDVLGPWRFYVDDAASTVTVDLQADGRYTQVIVGNRGQRTECPGGTWALDGPHLELTSYRSALRAVADRVRWFFGDWQKGFVLFAQDDPQSETMLLGLRHTAGGSGATLDT
jgi:hypothetical protein